MKTKSIFVLVGIAVCTLILSAVAFPAILTGVSADTDAWTLDIYGNANEDDCIDMRDYTYTARIICWLEDETDLADANYDGRISVADMTQIGLIILGRESELTIVDDFGRDVTIHKPVHRIVCAGYGSQGDYELLRALKAQEKVVGVCDYVKEQEVFFPELSGVTGIGDFPPDYEKIFALNPDLVTSTCEEDIQKCEESGISVIAVRQTRAETVLINLTKVGYILDKENEAKEFIDFIQDSKAGITEKTEDIPEDEKPTVYIESGSLYAGDYQIASLNGPPGQACALAGGRNIFTDISYDWCGPQVGAEWVIDQNPDIIIKMAYPSRPIYGYETDDPSGMKELRDEIMNRPELAVVNAVKNGQVYVISCNTVYPIYCSGIGAAYIAKLIYPDLFKDWDPREIHQQYVTEFQGLDFDIYEHGVFVYPPLE